MPEPEVDGLTVAYEQAGSGPPLLLLLLHGGFSDHRAWRRQLEGLFERCRVIAWDTPGCGGSSTPPSSFRLPDYADCLAGLVSGLGLDRPAEDLPARIPTSRLVLLDGVGHSSNLEAPERFNSELRRFLDTIEDEPHRPETANRWAPNSIAPAAITARPLVRPHANG